MLKKHMKSEPSLYDAELPNTEDVMTSLCCVATQYACEPSKELAALGVDLANTLNAPEYAKSDEAIAISMQLLDRWRALLQAHQEFEMLNQASEYAQHSLTMQ